MFSGSFYSRAKWGNVGSPTIPTAASYWERGSLRLGNAVHTAASGGSMEYFTSKSLKTQTGKAEMDSCNKQL